MKKLELKHLAPYLPYSLECYFTKNVKETSRIGILKSVLNINDRPCANLIHPLDQVKPILRPLSEIIGIEEICDEFSDHEWDKFQFAFMTNLYIENKFDYLSYSQAELMFKHRIDIFGLIEKGLAIDKKYFN